ncbi:MAG: AMP-binding protein, partial [Anaerolineae bacterium]|nr:AMP-binding protein [Anaerolineae bacterium]
MPCTPLDPWIACKIGCPMQPVTRAMLETYQLERLQTTLSLVRGKSRFYRDLPPDFNQIPFTTAGALRNNPLQFLCSSQDAIQRVVTLNSSGTTGRPKRLYFTAEDQELTIDFFKVGMSTFTTPGDRVLILLPGETPGSVGDLLAAALQRLGAVAIKHGPVHDPDATLNIIQSRQINVIVGVPTHVLALARQHVRLRLKSVLLTTDHVSEAIKNAVESAWNCTVYNHYGMTEMGLGGGVECEARCGYHLREADMLFEIVDPVTGKNQPDGTYGELVFTTLTRQGMPLIRYRTGDISRFIPTRCPCGTSLKLLEKIRHRLSGHIGIGEGCLTMAELDEALFSLENILDFKATIGYENAQDCLNLEIKWMGQDQTAAALDAVRSNIPLTQ